MNPRVLYRTHYQVDEPAIIELLIKRCTSPVSSAYDETIAEKLAKEVSLKKKPFNVPAAAYALDLARGLGVVNEQNVWSEKGHLVNLLADVFERPWDKEVELTPRERLLHFRLFIEGDGAALIFIARYLLEYGRVPNSEDGWNDLAKSLFSQIYSAYLKLADTTADRVSLRSEVERILARGYTGKSGSHKMFVHLQTLYRLGLIDRASSAARQYSIFRDAGGLRALVNEIPNLYELDRVIKESRTVEIAARVFQVGDSLEGRAWTIDEVLQLAVPLYKKVMETGVPLCPLTTIAEAIQIGLLARRSELLRHATLLELLQRAQRERPADVRFHVDRRGVPAFLKFSPELVSSYSSQGSNQTL